MKVLYDSKLKELSRKLRKTSTKAEIKLWIYIKGKQLMGYDFHRQKPIDNYIVDFFCNKLKLAVEVDGYTHGFEKTLKAVSEGLKTDTPLNPLLLEGNRICPLRKDGFA